MMKRKPALKTALGLGFLLFIRYLASSPADVVLARIDKLQAENIPAHQRNQIIGLQELNASWVVKIPRDVQEALMNEGISCETLDPAPAGKSYFLIFTPRPADPEVLGRYGQTKILDDQTCLFWTDDGREAREVLPADFKIKSLSLEDRISLSFDEKTAAGPGRVMGRALKPPVYDPLISQMVNRVSESTLSSSILNLQNFQTRYASMANCDSAGDYLYGFFVQHGLACEFDPFSFSSNRYNSKNVVATLPGKTFPQYIVIICAHYDSYSNQAETLAPGADDNASGTAAVMEIARILAEYSFDFTLKFIGFSAEEFGLYGSKHYAQEAKARGEKIMGVINMDMIAYADRLPEDLDLVVNLRSEWLANRFSICASIYTPLDLLKVVNANFRYSDHSSFWDQGYSAVCGIEDSIVTNPYYHKTTDTYSTLNMGFAASVTKIALAVAAGLAQPAIQ